ncbi:MAG: phosphomannose isomerase type II C-terminal cupin domain [bacterium]|nr:phosphomannose isomerase type II C-terminal cupin domain [bacterium]
MMELVKHASESRPWGSFERFTLNEPTTVKILTVNAGKKFSLQTHANRDEFWCIIRGSGFVTIGSETKEALLGDEFYIPRGTPHRATGGAEDLRLLEIAFGEFDENDEIRIEDDYGRV